MTEPQTAVPLPGDQVNENDDIVTLGRSNLQWVRLNSGLSLLDSAIVAVLGKGDQIVGVSEYGTSSWAETKRIDVQAIDGSKRSYFLKTLSDPDAEVRVHGEYEAMSAIYQTMPNMAPKPRGCGPCAEKKGTFFFVCDYVNLAHHKMTDEKYRREYFKHYPPSEPREEADDRNRLYSVQTRISTSLDFPGLKMREQIMADLNYLIDKYELRDK